MLENKTKKRISIVIPAYNRPKYLKQAIESIISQTRLPDEIIIGDDNPQSDENFKVVSEFQKNYPFIKYIKNEKNIGSAENYKKLIQISSGDMVRPMGKDDILLSPEAIETFEKSFSLSPDIKMVCSNTVFIDRKANPIINDLFFKIYYKNFQRLFNDNILDWKDFIKEALLIPANICIAFPMFRKTEVVKVFPKFRNFEFKVNFDWFLWMSILKGGKIFLSSKKLFGFRIDDNEQLNIEKQIEGIKEKLIFLSDDFLKYLEIDLKKEERSQALENVLSEAFYLKSIIENTIQNNKKKEYIENLDKEVLTLAREIQREASYKVYINLKKTREPFSIIIVTYNNKDTIEKCILSFIKTLKDGDEIIVTDNSSKDGTQEILKKIAQRYNDTKIRCIFNKENTFYTKAANYGAKISKNRFLVFLNPDTEVLTPDWLDIFYEKLKNQEIGAVGPISDSAMYKSDIKKYINIIWEITPAWLRYFFDEIENETKFIPGFCLATKKEILEKLGYFDEDLMLGMEDFDFCLKLSEAGLKTMVIPSIFIKHIWHVSFKSERSSNEVNKISILNFAKKLSKKFGYGNVPIPEKLFSDIPLYLAPYKFFKLNRFKFLFNFSNTQKDKNFFVQRAKKLHSKPQISVIVVNHNSSDDLKELVSSIIRVDYPNIKIVVVDNSENKEEFNKVLEIGKELGDKFFAIETENNGFAAGCNVGIKFAREKLDSEYIWLLNPDTAINKDTPFELLKTLLYTDVPVSTCKIKIYGTDKVHYNGEIASEVGIEDEEDYGLFRTAFLSGANIFLRSDIFDKVGFFREDFFLYFEDNEFFERLKDNGIYPIYTPFTFIYHKVKGNYGILEKPINLYYFIRSMLHFNYEFIKKGKYEKESMFGIFDKIEKIYLTLMKLNFEKSLKAVIFGIYDFLEGKTGRNRELENLLAKSVNDFIRDMNNIELPKRGEKVPIETYHKIMKINLLISPNYDLLQKFLTALWVSKFEPRFDYLYI